MPPYASSPLAAILYEAVISAWILSEVVIFAVQVTRRGGRREDRLSGLAVSGFVWLGVWVGLAAAVRLTTFAVSTVRPLVFVFGVALALAGIALRWYAFVTLGRFFTVRVKTVSDQTVVERGPYRLIRHPSYTGALMTVLGVLLCSTNWISLACFALTLPGFAYRIRVEERALSAALGEPYQAYMRRTKRLVPFVV